MNQFINSREELPLGTTGGFGVIPNFLHFLKIFTLMRLPVRLEYLRWRKTWWRGYMWLPMDSYWCSSILGLWCKPFKVFRGVISGEEEKLTPSGWIPTTLIAYCLRYASIKYLRHSLSLTKHGHHTRIPCGGGVSWFVRGITTWKHFFTQICLLFVLVKNEVGR